MNVLPCYLVPNALWPCPLPTCYSPFTDPRFIAVIRPGIVSPLEELLQHRSQNSRNKIVRLTGEGVIRSCGKSIGDRLRGLPHPCLNRATADHERLDRDGGQLFGKLRHVAQKGACRNWATTEVGIPNACV